MLTTQPLQGEFCAGHFGRIQLINCLESYDETINELEKSLNQKVNPRNRATVIHLIAKLCGVTAQEYTFAHTLLPFSVGIWGQDSEGKFQTWEPLRLHVDGMRRIRRHAYFCSQCVQHDIALRHFSYWRTVHQMPGMNWCWIHGCLLNFSAEENAFEFTPFHFLTNASQCNLDHGVTLNDAPDAIKLYLSVCVGMIGARNLSMLREEKIRLEKKIDTLNLERRLDGNLRYLSDLVIDTFPYQWLVDLFPKIHQKSKGKYYPPIDEGARPMVKDLPTAAAILVTEIMLKLREDSLEWLFDNKNDAITGDNNDLMGDCYDRLLIEFDIFNGLT